jgi:hypothetical protein
MIAKVDKADCTSIKEKIIELSELNNTDKFAIVSKIKVVVPEFISNNSEFEKLDKIN